MVLRMPYGEIQFSGERREIDGWCWSPDEPGRRLVVDILVDEQVIASMVAGQRDARLLNSGIGDGLHAFRLAMPETILTFDSLAARERDTGHEFARITAGEFGGFDPFAVRIGHLASDAGRLDAQIREREALAGAGNVRDELRQLGRRLRARASLAGRTADDTAISRTIARERLLARLGSLVLTPVASPALSIVIWAADADRAAQTIRAVAPVIGSRRGEIVVVDGGSDPRSSLLPSLVRNLRYAFDRQASTAGTAGNLASEIARGELLVFLDDRAVSVSTAALAELADVMMPRGGLTVGRDALELIGQFGCTAPQASVRRLTATVGLRAALPRSLFQELGQFYPDIAGAPGLDCADLALKADMMGLAVTVTEEPARPGINGPAHRADIDAAGIARAAVAFRQRWSVGPVRG